MQIPDGNRPPGYWLMKARDRVDEAKRELTAAEKYFSELSMAVAAGTAASNAASATR